MNSYNVFRRSRNNYCKGYVNSSKYINSSRKFKRFYNNNINMRWTKRKKKEFHERIKLIEEYKNKLYYSQK